MPGSNSEEDDPLSLEKALLDGEFTHQVVAPVDAEFTEVGDDGPSHRPQKVYPKRNVPRGALLLAACLIGGIIYWAFGRGENAKQPTVTGPPGWYDLLDCSSTVSLDGTKELEFFDDHRAVFSDTSVKENGKYHTIDGKWNSTKRLSCMPLPSMAELQPTQ